MAEKIQDVMSADPVTVGSGVTLTEVAERMRSEDLGAIVVTDDSAVRGIVTDRDIVVRGVAGGRDPSKTKVSEVLSGDVVSVRPDDRIERAVELIRERSLRRLPVLDGDRLVGMVSLADIAIERDESSVLADISAAAPNR